MGYSRYLSLSRLNSPSSVYYSSISCLWLAPQRIKLSLIGSLAVTAGISGPPWKIASAQLQKTWLQHHPGRSSKTTTKGVKEGETRRLQNQPRQKKIGRSSIARKIRVSEVCTVSAEVWEGKKTVLRGLLLLSKEYSFNCTDRVQWNAWQPICMTHGLAGSMTHFIVRRCKLF